MSRSLFKVGLFGLLVASFFFAGGFDYPDHREQTFALRKWVAGQWLASVLFYCGGAALGVWGDYKFGKIDVTSLRAVFVAIGLVFMVIGAVWSHNVKLLGASRATSPNKPDAPNLAVALRFHIDHHGRRVGDRAVRYESTGRAFRGG